MKIQSLMFSLTLIMHSTALMAMEDPLMQAIRDKSPEDIAIALITLNPNYYNSHLHTTPLALACQEGHVPTIEQLLKAGAEVDFQVKNSASWPTHPTALTLTALAGNLASCKLLLDRGANPNPHNPDNFTPLHAAARNGNADLVQLLIDHGARLDAQTKQYNATPLHEVMYQIRNTGTAQDNGIYQSCVRLLKAGANPNVQTRYVSKGYQPQILADKTPLMLAAERGKNLYVHLLLLFNADPRILDKNQKTASILAAIKQYKEIARLLDH